MRISDWSSDVCSSDLYEIRLADANDLRDVEAIVRDAYSHCVAYLGREPSPFLDDYAPLIREGRVSVIEYHGTVQGFLVLIPEIDALLLDNVAVSTNVRGSEIGDRKSTRLNSSHSCASRIPVS